MCATSLLTALPIDAQMPERGETPDIAGWFPAVGLLLGADALLLLALANAASAAWGDGLLLQRGSLVFAAVIMGSWAFTTRLLHWDGLADLADGFWGGHTPQRRLEIMSDTHTGAFGVSAVALVALLQVVSLSAVIGNVGVAMTVLAAPIMGRLSATFAAWLGTPARPGGLGAVFMGKPRAAGLLATVVAVGIGVGAVAWQHGIAGLVWSAVSIAIAAIVPHVIASKLGGVTGDVMGASVLLTEAIVLVLAALMAVW